MEGIYTEKSMKFNPDWNHSYIICAYFPNTDILSSHVSEMKQIE